MLCVIMHDLEKHLLAEEQQENEISHVGDVLASKCLGCDAIYYDSKDAHECCKSSIVATDAYFCTVCDEISADIRKIVNCNHK